VTKPLPFTAAGIARRIRGVTEAGFHPLGVTADGTVLIGDKPLDSTSLTPVNAQPSPEPKARMGEYFNGGAREA
jgi:hypothetical protein